MTFKIKPHSIHQLQVAEIISKDVLFKTTEEAFQWMIDVYYQGYDVLAVNLHNLPGNFLQLENGLAGEILQKFVNYQMKLVVIGDFSAFSKKSTQDFIRESNKGNTAFFLEDWADIPSCLK